MKPNSLQQEPVGIYSEVNVADCNQSSSQVRRPYISQEGTLAGTLPYRSAGRLGRSLEAAENLPRPAEEKPLALERLLVTRQRPSGASPPFPLGPAAASASWAGLGSASSRLRGWKEHGGRFLSSREQQPQRRIWLLLRRRGGWGQGSSRDGPWVDVKSRSPAFGSAAAGESPGGGRWGVTGK